MPTTFQLQQKAAEATRAQILELLRNSASKTGRLSCPKGYSAWLRQKLCLGDLAVYHNPELQAASNAVTFLRNIGLVVVTHGQGRHVTLSIDMETSIADAKAGKLSTPHHETDPKNMEEARNVIRELRLKVGSLEHELAAANKRLDQIHQLSK